MQKMLNAKRLECFLQVTISGSIRGAAEILGIDPSAVSRAIAQLEEETGLTLLERQGRGVIPTDTGLVLARYARRQQETLEELHNELEHTKGATQGHVSLGLGEGMLDIFFYPLITDYMREHPDITLDLNISSVEQHIQDLVEDKMNIAILYSAFDDVRLRYHLKLTSSPIQTIVHKDHPLTQIQRPLLLTDLASYPGATLHERFGLRQYVRAAEISERIQLRHVLITSSYRALWQFANAGLGYTLCGTSFASWFNMPDLVALPMKNPILQSHIAVVTRAGRHLSPAARSLLQHLISHIPPLRAAAVAKAKSCIPGHQHKGTVE